MIIGQVTMCGDNYGACLQAFALQTIVMEYGHTIKLLRYSNEKTNSRYLYYFNKIKEIGFSGVVNHIKNHSFTKAYKDWFIDFRKNYLIFNTSIMKAGEGIKKPDELFDKYICGSDMIWSEEFSSDWDYYFLAFAEKNQSYAYAPSFGHNHLSEENRKKVKEYLESFKMVSCRELGGVDLIRQLTDVEVTHVVDPTLLVDKAKWSSIINDEKRIVEDEYSLAYLFGSNDNNRQSIINTISNQVAPVIKIPSNRKEYSKFPIKRIGPIQFVQLFRDAKYVVTDTFHGLMFSIIFRKPFIVLERTDKSVWAKHSDRMTSTLEQLGLIDRYVTTDGFDVESLLSLDYSKREDTINNLRQQSLDYLLSILID